MDDLKSAILKELRRQDTFVNARELITILSIKDMTVNQVKKIIAELLREGALDDRSINANGASSKVARNSLKGRQNIPLKPEKPKGLPTSGKRLQTHVTMLGLFCDNGLTTSIESAHRKSPFRPIFVDSTHLKDEKGNCVHLRHHDVVLFKMKLNGDVIIVEHVGHINDAKVFSLMAIQQADVPFEFDEKAVELAQKAKVPKLGNRTDYRHLPLVTIDGEDARDFDDAVYACEDDSPDNIGGWKAIVAIADVAYYVRAFDALDNEAYERGNSIYFPDRVVPMLPEALSNEMCSLKPHEDRACLVAEIQISKQGELIAFEFKRGLMKSHARLTYTQVQKMIENIDKINESHPDFEVWNATLKAVYGTYKALRKARDKRGSLELEGHERKVLFDEMGHVRDVVPYVQHVSNHVIEEFMVAANVAAAKTLSSLKWPCLYRIHDKPDDTRILNLKKVVTSLGMQVPREKKMSAHSFNAILSVNSPYKRMIHDLVLRSQAQAFYSPENIGHYGLGLTHYAHFTSPIRRYADLCVHRALIYSLGLGEGGQEQIPHSKLEQVGLHISSTERQAAQLERDVMDRYLVQYLQEYVGHTFEATIVGVTGAGIFFELDNNGAQGFIHKADLPNDYYIFDEERHRYYGKRTQRVFQLGSRLRVLLEAANAHTSSTLFSLEPMFAQQTGKTVKKSDNKTRSIEESEHHREGKRKFHRRQDNEQRNDSTPFGKRRNAKQNHEKNQGSVSRRSDRAESDEFARVDDRPSVKRRPSKARQMNAHGEVVHVEQTSSRHHLNKKPHDEKSVGKGDAKKEARREDRKDKVHSKPKTKSKPKVKFETKPKVKSSKPKTKSKSKPKV